MINKKYVIVNNQIEHDFVLDVLYGDGFSYYNEKKHYWTFEKYPGGIAVILDLKEVIGGQQDDNEMLLEEEKIYLKDFLNVDESFELNALIDGYKMGLL